MSVRDGNPMDAFYDVGLWYMALVGAILWLWVPSAAAGHRRENCYGRHDHRYGWHRTVRCTRLESIVGRLVGGLYELYGISSYIGDFVSYTRLMALGLSSAFIGYAANLIVGMLFQAGSSAILGFVVF